MITALEKELRRFSAGTVVGVRTGLYSHVGLLGELNPFQERRVISFSSDAGGYLDEPLSQFVGQRQVFVVGYLGNLAPWTVLQRASAKRGQPYSWSEFNCDHFVRHAHGVAVESPQLQFWAGMGILAAVALVAARA